MTRNLSTRKMCMCEKHGMTEFAWQKDNYRKTGGYFLCMKCRLERNRRTQKQLPMSENPSCSSWLGVHIAERALCKFFKHITRTPYGFSGGDFICDKNYLIDVKCSCLHPSLHGKYPRWSINIRKNSKADYFLFLLFDNRENLTPMHVMLVPNDLVSNHISISISNTPKALTRWKKYEKPIDNVIYCCDKLRNEDGVQ